MGICVKVFAVLAILCVVTALPLETEVNDTPIDLLAVESSPLTDSEPLDELTRDKRHHRHHGYGKLTFN